MMSSVTPNNAHTLQSAAVGGAQSTTDAVPNSSADGKEQGNPVDSGKGTVGKIRLSKKLNIATVKFHALGHYPPTIRFFGPTDLYSTEWGESFHRSPKAWFKSTSKRFIRKEISQHERKRARLKRVKQRILSKPQSPNAQRLWEQHTAARDPNIHHHIGASTQSPVYLQQFTPNESGPLSTDPACLFFVRNLKQHLFSRFLLATDPKLEDKDLDDLHQIFDWSDISFKNDRIYTHRIMRIKFATYDTRRDEDIIHLDTDQSNVMLLNKAYSFGGSSHPFTYGKVIAIIHADVAFVSDIGRRGADYFHRRMEALWVRWYQVQPTDRPSGLAPDKAKLLPIGDPGSHGFVNPEEVLRACHMVPDFDKGLRYPEGVGKSAVANDKNDYEMYFINRFVDRDMFMRYEWGLAVGHVYSHKDATQANEQVLAGRSSSRAEERDAPNPTVESTHLMPTTSGQPSSNSGQELVEPSAKGLDISAAGGEGGEDGEGDERESEEEFDGDGDNDDQDYITDLERDSEDEREATLFGS